MQKLPHSKKSNIFCNLIRFFFVKIGDFFIYLAGFCEGDVRSKREEAIRYIAAGRVFMDNKEKLHDAFSSFNEELGKCAQERNLYLHILQDLYVAKHTRNSEAEQRIYEFMRSQMGFDRLLDQ